MLILELLQPRIAIVLLIAIFAWWSFKLWQQDRRLRDFKGPWSARFSQLWHMWSYAKHSWVKDYAAVLDKYGEIVRIGPKELVSSSPEVHMRINSTRGSYTKNGWFYHAARFEPGRDNVFSQTNEKLHGERRSQLAGGYSQRQNPNLEEMHDVYISKLIHLIRSKYCSSGEIFKRMDLAEKLIFLTVDLACAVGFGQSLGNLDADADTHGHIQNIAETLPQASFLMGVGLGWIVEIPWVHKLVVPENSGWGLGAVVALIRNIVHQRFTSDSDSKTDIIQMWAKAGLSEDDIVTESALQIVAGSDTIAATERGTLLHLFSNPRAYRTCQKEIDDTVAQLAEKDQLITQAEAVKLPYLQAVIKEGMRIFPPAQDPAPKVVPPEGDTFEVSGKSVTIPGGTSVVNSPWAMMYRKDIFGEDAEVFRPERWLEADADTANKMAKTVDLVFGYGRWQCLGMGVAKMQLNKIFFELLRNFDFTVIDPQHPWKSSNSIGVWVINDFWVRVEDRLN